MAACASLTVLALSACQAFAPQRSEVVDLTQRLQLTKVGDVITDGHARFVCVEDNKHWAYLMNVTTYKRTRYLPFAGGSAGCSSRLPADLKRVNTSVQYATVQTIADFPLRSEASFSGARILLRNAGAARVCGPNLPFYYTVNYPNSSYSFYLIVRLKTPLQLHIASYCANVATDAAKPGIDRVYQFYFGDEGLIQAIDTGNGATLLIDGNSNATEPVLLTVKSLPATVWSSQQNIFIVPRDVLDPVLQQAGLDPVKRFEALMAVIGQPSGYTITDQ